MQEETTQRFWGSPQKIKRSKNATSVKDAFKAETDG